MSVPKGQRNESRLAVQVKCEELVRHTVHIMAGKAFDPRYAELHARILDAAIGAGQDVWEANGIYVGDNPRRWIERRDLQERACRELDTLLYLMTISRRLDHLRSGKYRYWACLAREARDMARKWRDSDARRYRRLVQG
jgi:hypothetical protein